jgi:hypothetical protein
MSQTQITVINNTYQLVEKAVPYAGLYFIGKLIMDALNNSGHDFAQLKHAKTVQAVHALKIIWGCLIAVLLIISLLKS